MLGVLRTAYPFCCGSRHRRYRPNSPRQLISMFHPKWGLIQSTVFPRGREWAGRERIPSLIQSENQLCAGCQRCQWGPGIGLPHSVGRMPTQRLLSGMTGKTGGIAGIRRPLLGLWLLANHLLSSSLSCHTCKTARGFQTICTDAPGLAPQTVVSVY